MFSHGSFGTHLAIKKGPPRKLSGKSDSLLGKVVFFKTGQYDSLLALVNKRKHISRVKRGEQARPSSGKPKATFRDDHFHVDEMTR